MSGLHSAQRPVDGVHTPVAFEYADEATRLAATGFTSDDLLKFAHQQDTGELFYLTQITPSVIWTPVGNDALDPDLNKVLVKALKSTAGSIAKGTVVGLVVAVTGQTHAVLVETADYGDANTLPVIGLASETITDSVIGEVMVVGSVDGLDTSSLTLKLPLYLSTITPGVYTHTPPAGPIPPFLIGVPTKIDASNGVVSVSALGGATYYDSTPEELGTPTAGTSVGVSRGNHAHAHGDQAGGTLHADATTSVDGFMSAADKTKLDAEGEAAGQVLSTTSLSTSEWTSRPALDGIDLSVLTAPAYVEGRVFYDSDTKTLSYYNDESEVLLQIGRELWLRVYNDTAGVLLDGTVVYVNGYHGASGLPTVTKARADSITTAEVIGVATHDIGVDTAGYVTTFGVVRNLDTSSFSVGEQVFLSATTAGVVTSTSPQPPDHVIRIGYVLASDITSGEILVSILGEPGLPQTVNVSSNDATVGYLETKLVAGPNIAVSVLNEGASESLEVSVDADGEAAGQVFATTSPSTAAWTANPSLTSLSAGFVDFSGVAPSHQEGRVYYDNVRKALAVYNDEAESTLQVGQEDWVRCYNNTGSPITNGQAVYITGADTGTDLPTVALARSDAASTSDTLGLAAHTIENATVGYICVRGVVGGLDTSGFLAGDTLYLSPITAGTYQDSAPTAPNLAVRIGMVLDSDVSVGTILVHLSAFSSSTARVIQVSANDTTPDYLGNKIVAGSGAITLAQLNDGADEDLEIDVGVIDDTQHGTRGGGTLHAAATISVDGFLSASDKTKLDGVEAGATNTPLTNATPDNVGNLVADAGVSTEAARADHQHDVVIGLPIDLVVGASGPLAGSATSLSLSNHGHAIPVSLATSSCSAAAGSVGSDGKFVHGDHTHQISTGTPVDVTDSTNADGTANTLARSDHQHSHGSRGGGTLHAAATTSVNGFMSSADKTKLDGLVIPSPTEITATGTTSTTSTTFAVLTSMTATPAAGSYVVNFSTSATSTVASDDCDFAIFVDGVEVAHSRRHLFYGGGGQASETRVGVSTQALVTVNGSQAIDIRWRTTAIGTLSAYARSMMYWRYA